MYAVFSAIIVLASFLLIAVILIQKSKGGGLAASASGINQFSGVKRTTDFVEKATWTLALTICVLSILSCYVAPKLINGQVEQIKQLPVAEQQATPFDTPAQQPAAK